MIEGWPKSQKLNSWNIFSNSIHDSILRKQIEFLSILSKKHEEFNLERFQINAYAWMVGAFAMSTVAFLTNNFSTF